MKKLIKFVIAGTFIAGLIVCPQPMVLGGNESGNVQHATTVEEVEVLAGKDYFPEVRELLAGAGQSIQMVMYVIHTEPENVDDPVGKLVDELIRAHKRGVNVEVVLEDSKLSGNRFAYDRLKKAGVNVRLDSIASTLHSKAIVVDGEICIVGSTNWTRAALEDNYEVSLKVTSREIARDVTDFILSVPKRRKHAMIPSEVKGVCIPYEFMLSTGCRCGCGQKFLKCQADKVFDLYLLLLREFSLAPSKDGVVKLNMDRIFEGMGYGIHGEKDFSHYSDRVRRMLIRLEEKYGVLVSHWRQKKIVLRYRMPERDYFLLPYEYWEYGFSKSLSMRTKYAYLISLMEASKSYTNPHWFRSQVDLAQIYGISEYTISLGLRELERENIIEIKRSVARRKGDFSKRQANEYCLNALVNTEEFKDEMTGLRVKYGEDIVKKASKLAAQLNEPKDIECIEVFIGLIQEYGWEKVKSANDRTVRMKKGGGLRNIDWTINVLRGKSGQ